MHTQQGHGTPVPGSARGFTLIELMVSFSALLIVMLGFSRMLLSSRMASSTSQEATLAKEAARKVIEVLQATPLTEIYSAFNANTGDDPDPGDPDDAVVVALRNAVLLDKSHPVAAPPGFPVAGLDAPTEDADGLPGEILFPEQGGVLSELAIKPQYGWPMDMDRDGDVTTGNVSTTYRRLPVVVRVAWHGSGGD